MRVLVFMFALVSVASTSGCQCMQQMEQWKCDNWGMCHFAQQRPGVYSPMVLPPSYGVPPTGLAPVPTGAVYPASGMVPASSPAATYAAPAANPYPAATGAPYGGTVIPNSNCRECQK
jgi:hypothetical protein